MYDQGNQAVLGRHGGYGDRCRLFWEFSGKFPRVCTYAIATKSSTRVEEMPFRAWLKATVSNQRMNQRFDFPIRLHSGQFEGMRQWKEGSGDRTARRTAGSVGQQIKDVSGEDSYEKCMDRNNKGDNDRNDYS
ncbi:hypothetical protein Q3G72_019132 [Acer saccharum]|nr:hypothetical protein Q3G72_019132 [Acer saccharum]